MKTHGWFEPFKSWQLQYKQSLQNIASCIRKQRCYSYTSVYTIYNCVSSKLHYLSTHNWMHKKEILSCLMGVLHKNMIKLRSIFCAKSVTIIFFKCWFNYIINLRLWAVTYKSLKAKEKPSWVNVPKVAAIACRSSHFKVQVTVQNPFSWIKVVITWAGCLCEWLQGELHAWLYLLINAFKRVLL